MPNLSSPRIPQRVRARSPFTHSQAAVSAMSRCASRCNPSVAASLACTLSCWPDLPSNLAHLNGPFNFSPQKCAPRQASFPSTYVQHILLTLCLKNYQTRDSGCHPNSIKKKKIHENSLKSLTRKRHAILRRSPLSLRPIALSLISGSLDLLFPPEACPVPGSSLSTRHPHPSPDLAHPSLAWSPCAHQEPR